MEYRWTGTNWVLSAAIEHSGTSERDSVSEKGSDGYGKPRPRNPNEKVVLPWYLYWDGEKGSDVRLFPLREWELKARAWAKGFASGVGLGLTMLNGLTDIKMWTDVNNAGLDDLLADGGVEV